MWKVVIVDDDRFVLRAMKRMISWASLNAVCAAECLDGRIGLEAIERLQPDIVLTDVYMPVMGGLEMIESLRDRGFAGKIVILSGYNDFEYARRALRLDVEDYVSKPMSVETLEEVLGKVIAKLEKAAASRLEQEDLHGRLMLYEPFVRKEWIKSLLTGAWKPEELALYRNRQTLLKEGPYLVMVVEIVRTLRDSAYTNAEWSLLRFAVTNILKEVLEETWQQSEIVVLQSHFAAVLLRGEPGLQPDGSAPRVRGTASRIMECVGAYLRLPLLIGIGGWKHAWEEIPDSTEEAFRALALRLHSPLKEIDLYEWNGSTLPTAGSEDGAAELRPMQLFQRLTDAARVSADHVLGIIGEWTGKLRETGTIKPSYLQQRGQEVWLMLSYALEEIGLHVPAVASKDIRLELKAVLSVEQLEQWFAEKLAAVYARKRKAAGEKIRYKEAVDFMLDFIHEHYAEDISLSQLADKVYISRNHLANMFRDVTGETFGTYLTRVRMNQAKQLLRSGQYRIYQVAELVGYKNVPYFSTLFKKITGLNPSDLAK